MRPFCSVCAVRPRAVAYHKYGRIYYHSRCGTCQNKNRRLKVPTPRWQLEGYKKKLACDRCGFKSQHTSQLLVYHIDGNLNNVNQRNLRTVCLNCAADIKRRDISWVRGDIEVDF